MPSCYTHCMLSKKISEDIQENHFDLSLLLQMNLKHFQLGALTPDFPCVELLPDASNEGKLLADKFHHEKTDELFRMALKVIKAMPTGDQKEEALAFVLGFFSHVIADGLIHPFVKNIVTDNASRSDHLKFKI